MGISMVFAGYCEASCLRSSDGSICLEASSCPGGIAPVKGKNPRPANKIGSIIGQTVRNSKTKASVTQRRPIEGYTKKKKGETREVYECREATDKPHVTSRSVENLLPKT